MNLGCKGDFAFVDADQIHAEAAQITNAGTFGGERGSRSRSNVSGSRAGWKGGPDHNQGGKAGRRVRGKPLPILPQ